MFLERFFLQSFYVLKSNVNLSRMMTSLRNKAQKQSLNIYISNSNRPTDLVKYKMDVVPGKKNL